MVEVFLESKKSKVSLDFDLVLDFVIYPSSLETPAMTNIKLTYDHTLNSIKVINDSIDKLNTKADEIKLNDLEDK